MYTKIIVPFDGSDFSARAIPVARQLAIATHAPLEITSFAIAASEVDELEAAVRAEADLITDIEVNWRVQHVTDVVRAVSDELAKEPGALICMASVGRSHLAPVLGSIAEGVLHEAFGPLLLVGPQVRENQFKTNGPMLVCTDGSDTANAILPIAAQWAIAMPFDPWVIHVIASDGARVDDELAGDIGPEAVCARHVAHELQRDVARTVQYEVLHSDHPARTIAEYAADSTASVIAMATHGATGIRRVALGSVTMSVIHHAPCPVLVDRPPHLPADPASRRI